MLLVLPSNYAAFSHFWAPCWHTTEQTLLSLLNAALSSTVLLILFPLCLYFYFLITSVRLLKHKLHQFIPQLHSSKAPNQSKSQLSQQSTRLYRVWPTSVSLWLYCLSNCTSLCHSKLTWHKSGSFILTTLPAWDTLSPESRAQTLASPGVTPFPLCFQNSFMILFNEDDLTYLIFSDTPYSSLPFF